MSDRLYTVEVESASHEDVKAGNTATHHSRVRVLAATPTQASLIAAQMVACHGRMPTKTRVET